MRTKMNFGAGLMLLAGILLIPSFSHALADSISRKRVEAAGYTWNAAQQKWLDTAGVAITSKRIAELKVDEILNETLFAGVRSGAIRGDAISTLTGYADRLRKGEFELSMAGPFKSSDGEEVLIYVYRKAKVEKGPAIKTLTQHGGNSGIKF